MSTQGGPGAAAGRDRQLLGLVLVLTACTGIVDAVGYLGLDRVFTGNMTGNVVLLGMAVVQSATGTGDLPLLRPVVALAGFLAGAALGGRVQRHASAGWAGSTTGLLGAVAAGEAALSAALLVVGAEPSAASGAVVTAGLGAAMGVQAAVARRLAVKDVPTVVVTSTLTGLAADSWLAGRAGGPWGRRLGAVVLISAGAATGALLLQWRSGAALLLAAALTAAVAVAGHARVRARA